jgi:hypothetical protein
VPHRHKVHGTAIIVENKHVMVLQNMNMFSESDCAISNELQSNSNCTRLPALEQCSHRFTMVQRICMFKDMDDQPADCSYMGMYLGHGPFATEATCTVLVHMLDHSASVLTDPKRVTAVTHSNISLLSLFYFRIVTRQADPGLVALLLICTRALFPHPGYPVPTASAGDYSK